MFQHGFDPDQACAEDSQVSSHLERAAQVHRGGGRGQEGLEGGRRLDVRRGRLHQRDQEEEGHRGEVQDGGGDHLVPQDLQDQHALHREEVFKDVSETPHFSRHGLDGNIETKRIQIAIIRQNEKITKVNQSQSKDCQFEDLEKRFSFLTHSVALFSQNAQVTLLKHSWGENQCLFVHFAFF